MDSNSNSMSSSERTTYDVLMIDPPWPKKKGGRRKARPLQGRTLDYETMPITDIFDLLDHDVFPSASPRHAVFMWGIDQFLIDGELEMIKRGYKRHARLVWDKGNGVAPAFTVRYSHEYLTWWYKPKMLDIDKSVRGVFTTVLRSPGRQHSRKPAVAYEMLERLFPKARKLDVFSRESRSGWDQLGNEPNYFNPTKTETRR